MIGFLVKNVVGLGIPAILNAVTKRPITESTGSRTAAFATGVTWLGVVAQVITQVDALPGLESLIGAQGGTIVAILGIAIRAYREITTGPMAAK